MDFTVSVKIVVIKKPKPLKRSSNIFENMKGGKLWQIVIVKSVIRL